MSARQSSRPVPRWVGKGHFSSAHGGGRGSFKVEQEKSPYLQKNTLRRVMFCVYDHL